MSTRMPIVKKTFAENRAKLKQENPDDYQDILDALTQPEEELKRIITELQAKKGVVTVYDVFNQLKVEVFGPQTNKTLTKINFSSFINQKQAKLIKDLQIRERMAEVAAAAQATEKRVLAEKNKNEETLKIHIINNILDKVPIPSSKEEKFERLQEAIKEIHKFNLSYQPRSENRIDIPQMLQECYNKTQFMLSDEAFDFFRQKLVAAGEEDAIVQIFTRKPASKAPAAPSTMVEPAAVAEPSKTKPKVDKPHSSVTGLKTESFTKDQESESHPTPRTPKAETQPATVPNPFKEKNIEQYAADLESPSKSLSILTRIKQWFAVKWDKLSTFVSNTWNTLKNKFGLTLEKIHTSGNDQNKSVLPPDQTAQTQVSQKEKVGSETIESTKKLEASHKPNKQTKKTPF